MLLRRARVPGVSGVVVEARRVCAAAGQKGRNFSCTSKDGSCGPKKHAPGKKGVLAGGIEPTTLGLLDPRSDQLSYASDVSGRRRGRSEAPPDARLVAHREKPRGLTLDGGENEIATRQYRNGDPHLFRWRSTLCVLDNSCATANIKSQTQPSLDDVRERQNSVEGEPRLGKAHAGTRKFTRVHRSGESTQRPESRRNEFSPQIYRAVARARRSPRAKARARRTPAAAPTRKNAARSAAAGAAAGGAQAASSGVGGSSTSGSGAGGAGRAGRQGRDGGDGGAGRDGGAGGRGLERRGGARQEPRNF